MKITPEDMLELRKMTGMTHYMMRRIRTLLIKKNMNILPSEHATRQAQTEKIPFEMEVGQMEIETGHEEKTIIHYARIKDISTLLTYTINEMIKHKTLHFHSNIFLTMNFGAAGEEGRGGRQHRQDKWEQVLNFDPLSVCQ